MWKSHQTLLWRHSLPHELLIKTGGGNGLGMRWTHWSWSRRGGKGGQPLPHFPSVYFCCFVSHHCLIIQTEGRKIHLFHVMHAFHKNKHVCSVSPLASHPPHRNPGSAPVCLKQVWNGTKNKASFHHSEMMPLENGPLTLPWFCSTIAFHSGLEGEV